MPREGVAQMVLHLAAEATVSLQQRLPLGSQRGAAAAAATAVRLDHLQAGSLFEQAEVLPGEAVAHSKVAGRGRQGLGLADGFQQAELSGTERAATADVDPEAQAGLPGSGWGCLLYTSPSPRDS